MLHKLVSFRLHEHIIGLNGVHSYHEPTVSLLRDRIRYEISRTVRMHPLYQNVFIEWQQEVLHKVTSFHYPRRGEHYL